MSSKKNCWEAKKCGREPGGVNSRAKGVCPAAIDARLHGAHEGTNAGRACWVVAGTLCDNQVQGTYAKKAANCANCEFYKVVFKEEYPRFLLASVLLEKLRTSA